MARQKNTTGKAVPNKTVSKSVDAERDALAKELRSLIPGLDVRGLTFLVEQARIHLYNMQVDEINRVETAAVSRPAAPHAAREPSFRIETAESGSSCYLVYKGEWIMFSKDEMIHVVNLINAGGTDLETRERLFNWLARERRDVLSAVYVKDKFDDKLKAISALIKKTFKVRKKQA